MLHCGGLDLTRVGASAASSRDENEHVAMVLNVMMSQEDKISPAIVTTTEGEGDGKIETRSGER